MPPQALTDMCSACKHILFSHDSHKFGKWGAKSCLSQKKRKLEEAQ